MLSRRTILLKSMQPGLSGYARLHTDGEKMRWQLQARGLEAASEARLYRLTSGQDAQELTAVRDNARGELCTGAEDEADPQRLQALVLLSADGDPKPLLIGLLGGTLPDAKSAALALCERLKKPLPEQAEKTKAPQETPESAPAESPVHVPEASPLPREVFLPAIDPAHYAQADEEAAEAPMLPPPKRTGPAADRLRPLKWPRGFESLKPYFQNALPTALFDMPGWRFVYAAHAGGPGGLWLGIRRLDGRVCGVAYAHRGSVSQRGFRPILGLDGQAYGIMIQNL